MSNQTIISLKTWKAEREKKWNKQTKQQQLIALASRAIPSRTRRRLVIASWVMAATQGIESESHRSSRFQPATERFTAEPFPVPPLITGPRLWKVPPIFWFSGGTPVHSRWNTSLLPGQPFHYSSQIHGSPPFTFKLEDNHTADCSVNLAWEGLQLGCWPRLSCDGNHNESMALRGHSGWV